MPSKIFYSRDGADAKFVDKDTFDATVINYATSVDIQDAVKDFVTLADLRTSVDNGLAIKKSDVEPIVRAILQENPGALPRIIPPQTHTLVRAFPSDYVLGSQVTQNTEYGGANITTGTTTKHTNWSIRAKYFKITVGRTYQYSVRFNATNPGTIELVPYWGTTAGNAEGANYLANAPYSLTQSVQTGMNIIHLNIPVIASRIPANTTHITAYAYFYGGATGHLNADLTEINGL